MTVNGPVKPSKLGVSLIHEHLLVDFESGATDEIVWERPKVKKLLLPHLEALKKYDCKTLFDCTPSYLGKDVRLLQALADASGLQIITNTGYYGARDNRHIPSHAFEETAEQLAARWIRDFKEGMQGTDIRPGFMKIGSIEDRFRSYIKNW